MGLDDFARDIALRCRRCGHWHHEHGVALRCPGQSTHFESSAPYSRGAEWSSSRQGRAIEKALKETRANVEAMLKRPMLKGV